MKKMLDERKGTSLGLLSLTGAQLREVVRKEPITDVYDVEVTVFARGKFAQVRKATQKKSGISYAAKYIKKRRRAEDQTPLIHHEIAVLLKCRPNERVVTLHEVYETSTDMVLVLELAAGGELQHIFDKEEILDEAEARKAMKQILEGLSFLHENYIAHLDLKPQNLLLSKKDVCDNIKLCDFGISRILEPGTEVMDILGTTDYVSPEVLQYEPLTLAADIWSVGVLTYVMLSGFSPFGADDRQKTYLNISQGVVTFEQELFENVSNTAIDFIRSTLIVDPRKRPTVQMLLKHPWITPNMNIYAETSITVPVTPKSTPVSQRKAITCLNETPKSQRKSFDNVTNGFSESPVRSYTNCLCAQCGTTCRHSPHAPVTKPTITVDRGILC